jgi:phosphohistidine phosphatase SixA
MPFASRSRRHFVTVLALALLGASVAPGMLRAQRAEQGPTKVILVRHAEKAAVAGDDPPLSEIGMARARDLAAELQSTPPSAIIVTSLQRTALTAAEVAKASGVVPEVIPVAGGAAHIAAVVAAVRKQHGVVLVVGHSNTVTKLVTELGGPPLPDICDATYSLMFTLTPMRNGASPTLVVSNFGAKEPPPPATCAPMIQK